MPQMATRLRLIADVERLTEARHPEGAPEPALQRASNRSPILLHFAFEGQEP